MVLTNTQRAEVAQLLKKAPRAIDRTPYGDVIKDTDVMTVGEKKLISFRGYTHHVTLMKCSIVEICEDFGVTDQGQLVCHARMVGVPDGKGDYVITGSTFTQFVGQPYFTSGVWYVITIDDVHESECIELIEALRRFVS